MAIARSHYAFPSFAKLSSTDDIGCISRLTALFRWVRSTQILTLPFAFGTTTIPEHQSVGWITLEMIPCCSILRNSSSTLGSNGCGTLRGAYKHIGRVCVVSKIDMVLHLQLSKAVKQLWKVLVYSDLIHHQFD